MKYLGFVVMISTLFVDQLVKFMVQRGMHLYQSIPVIPSAFHITYVENDGAAWNIFSGNKLFLILIACTTLIFLYFFFLRNKKISTIEQISYSLFIGGVLGNLIDRIFLGHVIDYLDFTIFTYHYPVFNIADIGIVLGTILLVIDTIWGEKLWKKLR